MSKLPPLRWLVPIALLVVLAGFRSTALLTPVEDRIERRIRYVMRGVEAREARRIHRFFQRFYRDEDSGIGFEDVKRAAQGSALGSPRYRATLDPDDGIVFVEPPALDGSYERATVDLHFLVESRSSRDAPYEPYWDARARVLRAERDETMERLASLAAGRAETVAGAHGLAVEVSWRRLIDAGVTGHEAAERVRNAAEACGAPRVERDAPFRWSEDFGALGRTARSSMFGLGAGEEHPRLHAPDYDFPDGLIVPGLDVFERLVRAPLDPRSSAA